MAHNPAENILNDLSSPGILFEKLENDSVRCQACAHRCVIKPGKRGICLMRFNKGGELYVPWGYVGIAQTDPIEKKPFSHFLPGSDALTFGMLGCNFHCANCQNWFSSQTLRDPASNRSVDGIQQVSAEQIVQYALSSGASTIASSYNEPLISTEWAVEIFREAKKYNLRTVFVSNGFATPESLKMLTPVLDGYKVDLKTMQDAQYRGLGGRLGPVLNTIQNAWQAGLWVEVVTLVIPGFNDSPEELWEISRFICSISPDIPWHVSAFHPDYKMTAPSRTPAETLQKAGEIGQEAGLNYVYAGNLPGKVGSLENTYCPNCQKTLIKRRSYGILDFQITSQGKCPQCQTSIPGIWTD
ncbi:MAG: AmmeMemoRadiSam system radical SAM enzyme [Anaerolineaceae bacterium]|nr:AmmeMemoRadiSam system radical SAM enzyme [Anaerolineaceae bacterium]